jgi:hypothetical protein
MCGYTIGIEVQIAKKSYINAKVKQKTSFMLRAGYNVKH